MTDCDDLVTSCKTPVHDVAIPIVYPFQPITIPKDIVRSKLDQATLKDDVDVDATFRSTFNDSTSAPALRIVNDLESLVKVEGLGHAGIAIVDGASGAVSYFEYGRYDSAGFGRVRSVPIKSRLQFDSKGDPLFPTLQSLFSELVKTNGGPYAIEAVYVKVPEGAFQVMKQFSENRQKAIALSEARGYSIFDNHCFTFALEVVSSAGVKANVSRATPLTLKPAFTSDANWLERNLAAGLFSALGDIQIPARQMRELQKIYTPVRVLKSGAVTPFAIPDEDYR